MADPIEGKEFKFYLNFINDGTGLFQITEPLKWDASAFNLEQTDKAWARDTTFMNEEIPLEFYKGFWDKSDLPQTLPNGIVSDRLGHGIEYIFEYWKRYGFESEIEFIIERNGIQFSTGLLNYEECETDEITYFKCKVVQQTSRALAKRRETTKVDVFNDKDLDNEDIDPLVPQKVLFRAVPLQQRSKWNFEPVGESFVKNGTGQGIAIVPLLPRLETYEIDDSLSPFQAYFERQGGLDEDWLVQTRDETTIIRAQNQLSGTKISLSDVSFNIVNNGVPVLTQISISWGDSYTTGEFETAILFESNDDIINISNADYEYTVPNINSGGFLLIHLSVFQINPSGGGPISTTAINVTSGELDIQTTSTSISSTIKAVREIDFIKQTLKSANGQDLQAPRWEEGNEFYNQFVCNGNLLRQIEDKPFYTTLKDRKENVMEVSGSLQINSDKSILAIYDDYYTNVDNGAFLLAPNEEAKSTFNTRYAINQLTYEYGTYEKNRDEINTNDGVHTETQWNLPNKQVSNKKTIKITDIRDGKHFESQRRLALKSTTALDSDNKVFKIDCIPLAPGSTESSIQRLNHNFSNGELKLLNDSTFNWGLLGFDVGDIFHITSTDNAGSYEVLEITNNILTLSSSSALTLGEIVTAFTWPLTNVAYVNRTNEEFDLIENITGADRYPNLRFTIKRNLNYWQPYLNTSTEFSEGVIQNSFFVNNPDLKTQFQGGEIIVEGADFELSNLRDKKLSSRLYTLTVIAEFDKVLELVAKYEDYNTFGGFIRVQTNDFAVVKGYPQQMSYVFATKKLDLVLEMKAEGDFVEVDNIGGIITINEVGYDQDILPQIEYLATGEYIVLKDLNGVNLINLTKFDRVKVEGQVFESIEDLTNALDNL